MLATCRQVWFKHAFSHKLAKFLQLKKANPGYFYNLGALSFYCTCNCSNGSRTGCAWGFYSCCKYFGSCILLSQKLQQR